MGKNVIVFPHRKSAADSEKAASRGSRIIVRVGKQRYALDIGCQATVLPPEPANRLIETKFRCLRKREGIPRRDGESWSVCDSTQMI